MSDEPFQEILAEAHKARLYRQGTWEQVDNPDNDLSDDITSPVDALHYDEKKPEVHGIEPHYCLWVYRRNITHHQLPPYPYYVEFEVQGFTQRFYIADFPSYLQIVPQLIDQVQHALQLAQFVKHLTEGKQP